MNRWLALELEKLVEINKTPHSAKWQTTPPFCLFNYDGKLLTLAGNTKKGQFTTPFFIVKAVDTKKNCALLELLFPFPIIENKHNQKFPLNKFCCVKKLFHTKSKLFVNLADFCGLTFVEIPVFDYLTKSRMIKDSFCLAFCLLQNCPPQNIWETSKKTSK
ncbi:CotY/CotZ family spore coat protein [Bacillus cereus]